jgi:hypothetical protein
MKHLKLFENFGEDDYLDSIEDYLIEWLDTGEARLEYSNEWIRIYTFKSGESADQAKRRLVRMGQPGWWSEFWNTEIQEDVDSIILFKPELEEFLDEKLLNSEILPSKEDKNILIWKKEGEVRANQDLKNGEFLVKWSEIWSVFDEQYSMENACCKAFIRGWLEERYGLGGLAPTPDVL